MMATNLIPYNNKTTIDLLRIKLNELNQTIASISFEIDSLFEKFGDQDVDILQELALLEARISDMKETSINKEIDTTIVDTGTSETEVVPVTVKTNVKKLCKKMYLEICRKCHPDKVQDNRLVQMFHQAKRAMLDLNLGMLEAILLSVDESLFNPIEDKDTLAFLQLEVRKYEQELATIKESEEYQILEISQNQGFYEALTVRSRSLRVTRANLREELFNLGGNYD